MDAEFLVKRPGSEVRVYITQTLPNPFMNGTIRRCEEILENDGLEVVSVRLSKGFKVVGAAYV